MDFFPPLKKIWNHKKEEIRKLSIHILCIYTSCICMLAPSAGSSVLQRGAERAQGPPVQRIGLLEIPEQAKSLNDCLQDCIDQSSRLIKYSVVFPPGKLIEICECWSTLYLPY